MEDKAPERGPGSAFEASAPGFLRTPRALAHLAAAAYWRSARWTVGATTRAGRRAVRAASNGQSPSEVFRATRAELQEQARRFLGIPLDPEPQRNTTGLTAEEVELEREEAVKTLRERGAELLRRSADVNFEEDAHPAYARILDDLAPDEGRILRLLMVEGPQPSVDIRAGWIPLRMTTELVAPGRNMIGAEAGCRHQDDVPAYLNNLFRLGLIWFSSEPIADPLRYQVLEAQPDVSEAIKEAGRAHTVRRSIELTPFGKEFCRLCLPVETSELEALPGSVRDVGEPDAGEDGDRPG
jgi:Abortive infection alpha